MMIWINPCRMLAWWIVFSLCCLAGCATVPKEEEKEKISTLPWNTPQKWEHSVPIGDKTY